GLTATETGAIALWEVAADVFVLALGSLLWLGLGRHSRELVDALPPATFLVAGGAMVVLVLGVLAAELALRRRPHMRERFLFAVRTVITAPHNRPGDAVLVIAATVLYWGLQGVVLWSLVRALSGDSS